MEKKVSYSGLISKSIIGLIIVFLIAIPRLLTGNDFFKFIYTSNIFLNLLLLTITMIVLGIIWTILYRLLRQDKGIILNWVIYIATMILLGLLTANALIVATGWISYYGALSITDIQNAVNLAFGATSIAVLAGIIILPKLTLTDRKIRIGANIGKILFALALVQFLFYFIGIILSIFHIYFIINLYRALFYGTSILSIALSFFVSFIAILFFMSILGYVKSEVNNKGKYFEFYLSAILVNAIIRIYIEMFKLILKIIARGKRR